MTPRRAEAKSSADGAESTAITAHVSRFFFDDARDTEPFALSK
jgi:hypothetical protein